MIFPRPGPPMGWLCGLRTARAFARRASGYNGVTRFRLSGGANEVPIHDWTRVSANLFHDFHQTWSINIRNALNGGLLPAGYSALVEQHAGGLVPDVIALQGRRRQEADMEPTGGAVVTAAPPKTKHVIRSQAEFGASRANRITIRHSLGRVVCVIEIVSPGNKASLSALRAFVDKTVEFSDAGVHLLVIDLFPPSVRDPQGIHKAIWDRVEDRSFELPEDKRLTLVAYVSDAPRTAYVEPIGVGDVLPDMPAYLSPDSHVPIPLESTYQTTWLSCPPDMRDAVEHGGPRTENA